MGEQLKVQTLYDVAEEDGKNLVWTDVYVSGTEGASGVYSTRRLTWTQLLAYINSNISKIVGSGTLNYVPKFTPDGATIGDSQIQDDGTNLSIGTSISVDDKILVQTSSDITAVNGINNTNGYFGVVGECNAVGTGGSGANYGVLGKGYNHDTKNVGVSGDAQYGSIAVGLRGSASGATNNYSVQLLDGSQQFGRFLKCLSTSNGYGKWADITASDISSFVGLPCEIQLAVSDETTALTTGTGKLTFRMPHAMTLTEVRASLTTAQTSGGILTVDINKNGSTIFIANWLTIDNGEKTSVTALDQPIINVSSLADDDEITIDIDQIGSGDATGLKILLKGTRA